MTSLDDLLAAQRAIHEQALLDVTTAVADVHVAERNQQAAKDEARRLVEDAKVQIAKKVVDRDEAIRVAVALGIHSAAIAEAAEVSASTVSNIAAKPKVHNVTPFGGPPVYVNDLGEPVAAIDAQDELEQFDPDVILPTEAEMTAIETAPVPLAGGRRPRKAAKP